MLYQFCIANNAVETRFDPSLVTIMNDAGRNPIKVHQLLSSTLSHTKLSFQQIFYNFKPFAQIKIDFNIIRAKLLLSSIYVYIFYNPSRYIFMGVY